MKAKRLFSAALLMLSICSVAFAQKRADIMLSDRSILSCDLANINYMEVVEGAGEGELDGVWYLGWLFSGTATKKDVNGTETIVFTAGPKMTWLTPTKETTYYLTYGENGALAGESFTIQVNPTSTKVTYKILEMADSLLVLKQGTKRYFFYNTRDAAIYAPQPTGNYAPAPNANTGDLSVSDPSDDSFTTDTTPKGRRNVRYGADTETSNKRVDIRLKDNSIISCPMDAFNYLEVVERAGEGELDGLWYLGWKRYLSNGTEKFSHSNGTEFLVFTGGPRMKWIKAASEQYYDLTYSENGANPGEIFYGVREGNTSRIKFQIFAMEKDLLVIVQGNYRYYFYPSREAAKVATQPSGYYLRAQYGTPDNLWASNLKGGYSGSTKTPMGKHFEKFAAATDEDKAWLADPNNQPDLSYHELSGSWSARTINLYPFGSPVPADINQHGIGDCSMCAVFASFAYIYPEWIKTIIVPNNSNTLFTIHMFDPMGNPIDVIVDNKMYSQQVTGKNGVFCWTSIMEKALMKWETRFRCNKIGGIGTEHAAPPFTGNGTSYSFNWGDYLYNAEYPLIVDYALSHGMISVGGFHESGVMMGDLESVTGHAFTVMYADEGSDYLFVMRNPWGNEPSSGSTASNRTDGKLKIPDDHSKLRLVDFRLVFPGEQMAQYKKENLRGYTPPRFRPMYMDLNPSDEMLRMYNVKDYKPIPVPVGKKLTDFVDE